MKKIRLIITKRTNKRLISCMKKHYSKPKGFVGRNICYAVMYGGKYYGHIVGGSATKYLVNRDEFFNIESSELVNIVNNIFFHIFRIKGKYPCRNFSIKVVKEWREKIRIDWEEKYGDVVMGYETLVEPPRDGYTYFRDGWSFIGITKGFTCKRVGGKGTDSWSGRRIWDTTNLRPKLIFVRFP